MNYGKFKTSFVSSILPLLIVTLFLISHAKTETKVPNQIVPTASSQLRYNVPFLVLMSDDEVSIAQLPLIDNGNVGLVYALSESPADRDEDEEATGGERKIEDFYPSTTPDRASSRFPQNADAREYEQMPPSSSLQTTTSLGKSSDSQQIASNFSASSSVANNGNNFDRQEVVISRSEDIASREEANSNQHGESRPKRSNSFVDFFKGKIGNEDDERSAGSVLQRKTHSNAAAAVPESSSTYSTDVTSAPFGTRLNAAAESRTTNQRIQREASKIAPKQTEDHGSGDGTVRFSDFDVHMALGYAFVSDTSGRIHRFKLSGFESGASVVAASQKENDNFPNTIDSSRADDSLSTSFGQHRRYSFKNATTKNTNGVGASNNYDHPKGYANNDKTVDDSSSNKVVDVTHEQSGQHPSPASGLLEHFRAQTTESNYLNSASMRAASTNQKEQWPERDANGPRIIWSRFKHGYTDSISAPLESKAHGSSRAATAATTTNAEKSAVKGALSNLPQPTAASNSELINSTADRHLGSASLGDEADREEEEQQLLAEQISNQNETNEVERNQTTSGYDCGSPFGFGEKLLRDRKRLAQSMKTEVAVDWMNNLLFVLDKYRLVVTDFDGNNELVLIDDFNVNNRPIDIKVDPVNDFLFWLQMGNFHNTIYKFDMNVLSLPTATERLLANTIKLNSSNGRLLSNDQSELVALISHHYAHPIITNLPKSARLFTIDHKHSRIYVPLPPSSQETGRDCNRTQSNNCADAETFESSGIESEITHMNSSANAYANLYDDSKNCSNNYEFATGNVGQILVYNLDGTDVGPLRSAKDKAHLSSLDDMQDITLDSDKGFLYWLTNNGQELFEEYKTESDSSFYSAQHNLDGKKYKKLIHFGSNQPRNLKPRFNLKKLIQILTTTTASANRQIRSGSFNSFEDGSIAYSSWNSKMNNTDTTRFARNAPYIILGVTGLIVLLVYIIYFFIFQQPSNQQGNNRTISRDGSMSSSSSVSESQLECGPAGRPFSSSNPVTRWLAEPAGLDQIEEPTLIRQPGEANNQSQLGIFDDIRPVANFHACNAIAEHYRDVLTNWTQWPSNVDDTFNNLYVPKEILDDKEFASIRRISLDQLEVERCDPLGEGHFGYVQQGTIVCSKDNNCFLHSLKEFNDQAQVTISVAAEQPSAFSTAYDGRRAMVQSSTGSSGHGSSSTSSDFVPNPSNLNLVEGDYLTPKSHCNSSMSDYALASRVASPRPDSYSSYYNSSVCQSTTLNQSEFKVNCANSNLTSMKVAIKRLKPNASDKEKADFLQEAKRLAKFNHPNIVPLLGICLDRGHTLIVMELMLGGDLENYLRKSKPRFENADNLTELDLLKICLDIVNGCCHLEMLKYIHRDLAARNCLVSSIKKEERVIKLADFGLARDIYKDKYYKKVTDSAMPLKWMAPECLIEQKFTTKSDVWSFGVVMWEVMSFCLEKPYGNVEPCLMEPTLKSGHRLAKPKNCCDDLYELMHQCWQLEPDDRPTFSECKSVLMKIMGKHLSQSP